MTEQLPRSLVDIDTFIKFSENLDYLIVGGGTAGLALATRLSEDPDINVGVLEVGEARLNDPNVLTPLLFSTLLGDPAYDWDYKTTSQTALNDLVFRVPRGKVLGGTSAINWMVYARGQKEDYDDWEILGNHGWNWNALKPYFLKSENYQGDFRHPNAVYDQEDHNIGGPISTSFPPFLFPIEEVVNEAAGNSGLDWNRNKDPGSGSTIGGARLPSTVHRSEGRHTRSYSVNGYYLPVADRSNLAVLTEALATKVLLRHDQDGVVATGIEFEHKGTMHSVQTRREVILSGGTYESPKLLELSGIGKSAVLVSCGIDVVVESPHVGENLQDHFVSGCIYELVEGETSLNALKDPEIIGQAMQEYGTKGTGLLTAHNNLMGSVAFASIANDEERKTLNHIIESNPLKNAVASAERQRKILSRCYSSRDSANLSFNIVITYFDAEMFHDLPALFAQPGIPGKHHITITNGLRQPFSRGSVHIQSKNPHQQVALDPAYLSHPADIKILSTGLTALDKITKTEPLASKIAQRVFPSPDFDMNDSNAREEYIRRHISHEWHPVGSCSMGEVVDERLRVLGVKGLRVVDASIIPLGTSANTQSVVYAIAEKAADMIKEDRIRA